MDKILEIIASEEFRAWVAAVTALITAANGITMLTPTKTDNNILNVVLKVLNFVSLNILKNKNADA